MQLNTTEDGGNRKQTFLALTNSGTVATKLRPELEKDPK
jgi:hypothetical protein